VLGLTVIDILLLGGSAFGSRTSISDGNIFRGDITISVPIIGWIGLEGSSLTLYTRLLLGSSSGVYSPSVGALALILALIIGVYFSRTTLGLTGPAYLRLAMVVIRRIFINKVPTRLLEPIYPLRLEVSIRSPNDPST